MKETVNEVLRIDDRLSVRPINIYDTDNIIKWRNNPRVMNNFLYRTPFTPEIHNNWMATKIANKEAIQFIILANDIPVGSVYFRDIDYDLSVAEYGIFIGEDNAIGLGYGTIIANWAVEYAKSELGMKSLRLRVLSGNTVALKIYTGVGYKCVDTTEDYIDGRDLILMNIEL